MYNNKYYEDHNSYQITILIDWLLSKQTLVAIMFEKKTFDWIAR
jgi:hypothetical protein